ncbi:MAG TPA: sigma-70 family RNA polymerase sigma factor [Polyangia bacterium]|nr:sigma-70 family RNA polymerase sigma factor [Polyangia bacterium]
MGEQEGLVAAFLSRAGAVADRELLAATLAAMLTSARAAWPKVALAAADFARALAERMGPEEDALAALAQLRAGDVYLAAAVAADAPGAIAAFEETILSRVPSFLGRGGASATTIDEVKQLLRIKLLVGDADRPPRIRQYSGRGALESWVCAAAIRAARDLHRADERRRDDGSEDLDVLAASDDPELESLRRRYRADFRAALREAIGALAPRQRTLLRLHFFERVTTVELGRLYGVNQSTTSRWLTEARTTVLDGVRARLREKLGVSTSEFDSLVGLLHSRLDASFVHLLGERGE